MEQVDTFPADVSKSEKDRGAVVLIGSSTRGTVSLSYSNDWTYFFLSKGAKSSKNQSYLKSFGHCQCTRQLAH
jgi:hypothetical protein